MLEVLKSFLSSVGVLRHIVVIVAERGELDLLTVLIKNANVKCKRLELLNKNLEGLGNTGSRNVLTFNDSLVSVGTSLDIVRLNGKDFLKGVCCAR